MPKGKKHAKAKRPSQLPSMPVCIAMLICEKVIVGNDKTATIIRMVDTIGVPPDKKRKTGDMIQIGGVSLFFSLKRGDSSGNLPLFLECLDPKGKRTRIGMVVYKAEGSAEAGANTIAPVAVRWAGEGVYWLELRTPNESLVARTPTRLLVGDPPAVHARIQTQNATSGS